VYSGVFCASLLYGDKSEYVVATPQYRAAANTAMGWKNANLLTELRIEIHAGQRVLNNSPFSNFPFSIPRSPRMILPRRLGRRR
jgi:hypothetical protein